MWWISNDDHGAVPRAPFGRLRMNAAAAVMNRACTTSTVAGRENATLAPKAQAIITDAMALWRGAMAPLARQSAMIGPKTRLRFNRSASAGELFAKKNAARITKGVVGKSGRTIPIAPSPSASQPNASHKIRSAGPATRLPDRGVSASWPECSVMVFARSSRTDIQATVRSPKRRQTPRESSLDESTSDRGWRSRSEHLARHPVLQIVFQSHHA